jgi:mono/diheme cytochrome c family protein
MAARVVVESKDDYDAWVLHEGPQNLGRNEWLGVCAKCHGLSGQGGYGPNIATSTLLVQPQGLRDLLTHGQNRIKPTSSYMPPVARAWTDDQFRALGRYLKAVVYKGDTSGG